MVIDPSRFHLLNVADTCAVWNVLSSIRLYNAAKEARCLFCITDFVRYECLAKARKGPPSAADSELMSRLNRERSRGHFESHACTIEDLQSIALLERRRRLGKGELSSIAFAMKIRQAVITDDQKARKLAAEVGHAMTQTTPHLFGWLYFRGHLGDSDLALVVAQHEAMDQDLTRHFHDSYALALICKRNSLTLATGVQATSAATPALGSPTVRSPAGP